MKEFPPLISSIPLSNLIRALDFVRLIEDCQLGIMGLVEITWEGAWAHGECEGINLVRLRYRGIKIACSSAYILKPKDFKVLSNLMFHARGACLSP
nr:hypothetical protein [Tanacetum cinerariifolium]